MVLPPAIKKLLDMRVVRVAAAGGAGVIAQTIVFETLGIWLGWVRPSTAVLIGAELGIIINFTLSNRFAFGDRRHTSLWGRLVRFHIVVAGALVIQWLCVYLTETTTQDWLLIHAAYAAGLIISFFYNYTGYRLWVWRHTPTL
ncbi:GtrA family protein [Candidatus Kaiserbacteria bacterium]|nr:GtrA family protein [Candidatus Kaiserbacteria bacterium]